MHLASQLDCETQDGKKAFGIKEPRLVPMDEKKRPKPTCGQDLPMAGKGLATPPRCLPEQEEFVQLLLLAPARVAFVLGALMIPKTLERFPFAPGLLKNLVLLIAHVLDPFEFTSRGHSLLRQEGLTGFGELQFGCGGSAAQLAGFPRSRAGHLLFNALDQMAHPCDLLVGGAQTQFLLMLDTSSEVQNGLERETEGHMDQVGKASNCVTVLAKGLASSGFCRRNRCSSGISASALSSVASLPF